MNADDALDYLTGTTAIEQRTHSQLGYLRRLLTTTTGTAGPSAPVRKRVLDALVSVAEHVERQRRDPAIAAAAARLLQKDSVMDGLSVLAAERRTFELNQINAKIERSPSHMAALEGRILDALLTVAEYALTVGPTPAPSGQSAPSPDPPRS